jgi:hypothetical protein
MYITQRPQNKQNAKILVVGATVDQILEVTNSESLSKKGAFQAESE